MSAEGMIRSLYDNINFLRISVRNLALERIIDRTGMARMSLLMEEKMKAGEAMEKEDKHRLDEIRKMAEDLLLGDAEMNLDDLAKKIDSLEDDRERKTLNLFFAMIR